MFKKCYGQNHPILKLDYTISLATISMVEYILGLGYRYPSNIILQKNIYLLNSRFWRLFCQFFFKQILFKQRLKREKNPEKVPFRLSKLLAKAVEACGTHICNTVMRNLRDNKESLSTELDLFVYYPIFFQIQLQIIRLKRIIKLILRIFRLIKRKFKKIKQKKQKVEVALYLMNDKIRLRQKHLKRKDSERDKELYFEFPDEEREIPDDLQNKKDFSFYRIKKKLMPREFKDNETLKIDEQVKQLILQAISHENIAQASWVGVNFGDYIIQKYILFKKSIFVNSFNKNQEKSSHFSSTANQFNPILIQFY